LDYGPIKLSAATVLGAFFSHLFKLFSQNNFKVKMNSLIFLRKRKYCLEYKCERNLSVLLLFSLGNVACYFNFLERMVPEHPLSELAKFIVCLFLSLVLKQIELTCV